MHKHDIVSYKIGINKGGLQLQLMIIFIHCFIAYKMLENCEKCSSSQFPKAKVDDTKLLVLPDQ